MKRWVLVLVFAFISLPSWADTQVAKTLLKEWSSFRAQVSQLRPDGMVGGLYHYKEFGSVLLMWKISADERDNEVIRFFMEREGQESFAVTYHRSHQIMPGTVVLRRFVGPELIGWVNHTIDFHTHEFYGSQGVARPHLRAIELQMLKDWNITQL